MDKTYKAFIRAAQQAQRAYIRSEEKRMDKAERLLWKLKDDFAKLGLHALSLEEVNARRRELADMLFSIPETHGDTETMRWAYEQARRGETKSNG